MIFYFYFLILSFHAPLNDMSRMITKRDSKTLAVGFILQVFSPPCPHSRLRSVMIPRYVCFETFDNYDNCLGPSGQTIISKLVHIF